MMGDVYVMFVTLSLPECVCAECVCCGGLQISGVKIWSCPWVVSGPWLLASFVPVVQHLQS